jgi:hypothetical protein
MFHVSLTHLAFQTRPVYLNGLWLHYFFSVINLKKHNSLNLNSPTHKAFRNPPDFLEWFVPLYLINSIIFARQNYKNNSEQKIFFLIINNKRITDYIFPYTIKCSITRKPKDIRRRSTDLVWFSQNRIFTDCDVCSVN